MAYDTFALQPVDHDPYAPAPPDPWSAGPMLNPLQPITAEPGAIAKPGQQVPYGTANVGAAMRGIPRAAAQLPQAAAQALAPNLYDILTGAPPAPREPWYRPGYVGKVASPYEVDPRVLGAFGDVANLVLDPQLAAGAAAAGKLGVAAAFGVARRSILRDVAERSGGGAIARPAAETAESGARAAEAGIGVRGPAGPGGGAPGLPAPSGAPAAALPVPRSPEAVAAADAAAAAAGSYRPLTGLPQKPIRIGDQVYVPGPQAKIKQVAEDYMASAGLPYDPPNTYAKVDKERAGRIANAFDAMPHTPDDPAVA